MIKTNAAKFGHRALGALILVAVWSVSGLAGESTLPARRPNVLFFAVDDLRCDLGCYGNTIIKSPSIDALAARGVVFLSAYCQQSLCSPSRSSLMTGARPDTTGVIDLTTHFRTAMPEVVTLPQHFKNNGYFTEGKGKIYHIGFNDPPSWSVPWRAAEPWLYRKPENNAGFDARVEAALNAGLTPGSQKYVFTIAKGPAFEDFDGPDNSYADGLTADWAIDALSALKQSNQPFFLAVGISKPHLPFNAPKKYWDLYKRGEIQPADFRSLPKGALPYSFIDFGELRNFTGIPAQGPVSDDLARTLKHGYYACVSYADAQVGRILRHLQRLGLDENTIVVLWGDNGYKLGEYGKWTKHSNFELDLHVPLIIAGPGVPQGIKTDSLTELVDVYPTLAELAQLPLPSQLEGSSLVPLLKNNLRPEVWKQAVFAEYPRDYQGQKLLGYAMRTNRYLLTRWVPAEDHSKLLAVELYDLKSDPEQRVNVADTGEGRKIMAELMPLAEAGWKDVRARLPQSQP